MQLHRFSPLFHTILCNALTLFHVHNISSLRYDGRTSLQAAPYDSCVQYESEEINIVLFLAKTQTLLNSKDRS